MKNKSVVFSLITAIVIVVVYPWTGFATSKINLYKKPDEKSAVIKKINANAELIPLFFPKNKKGGDRWVKVAEPDKEGGVGWIRLKEFKGPLTRRRFNNHGLFEEESIRNDDKNHIRSRYRRFEYDSADERANAEKMGRLFSRMWQRIGEMQLLMDAFIRNLDNSFDQDFDDDDFYDRRHYQRHREPTWWERLKRNFSN